MFDVEGFQKRLQSYPSQFHKLQPPCPEEPIQAMEKKLGNLPDPIKTLLHAFNGADLFEESFYFFGISNQHSSPDSLWYIDRFTPRWREVGAGRQREWAIAMTNYGGLILVDGEGFVKEWDTEEAVWLLEGMPFNDWIEKMVIEGEAITAVLAADRAAPSPFAGMYADIEADLLRMTTNSNEILQRIEAYPDALKPLVDAVRRYLKYPSVIGRDGVMRICHRPWVGRLNYLFELYPGIKSDDLDRYSARFNIEIPQMYAEVLHSLNGAFCVGGLSFCGIPPTMLGDPPLLDATKVQCLDLAAAATQHLRGGKGPAGLLPFAARHYSHTENVDYFIDKGARVVGLRKEAKVVGEWNRFADFLADELDAAEKFEATWHPWP